jgi:sulfate transport system substrate-binding protein
MMIGRRTFLNIAAAAVAIAALSLILFKNIPNDNENRLINVSYDPTRELYQAINPLFVEAYAKQTGHHLTIEQSHGGSSRQAGKVISGEQPADIVTLGLFTDVEVAQTRSHRSQLGRAPSQSLEPL